MTRRSPADPERLRLASFTEGGDAPVSRACRHQCDCREQNAVVLEVLCRVFEDGADQGIEDWRAFYQPDQWLGWPRALGAFIHRRLRERAEKHSAAFATAQEDVDRLAAALHGWYFEGRPGTRWADEDAHIRLRWREEASNILSASIAKSIA